MDRSDRGRSDARTRPPGVARGQGMATTAATDATVAEKYEGVVDVVKVDVDANPGLSQAYQIMSIPTIAYFKPGDQPKGVVGFQPMEQLERKFGLTELPAPGVAADAPTEGQSAA